jgi:Arc/MetJ-type ribon-helix-helix transcriptional regulator
VVYNGVVSRTQVYLGEHELALLDEAAQRTGASRSELIRRSIRAELGTLSTDDRRRALRASAGSWQGRDFTGREYVDAIRGDLSERLARVGLR